MIQPFYFSITYKDDPTEVSNRLTVPAETQEIATDFANQEFEEYKNGLLLESEEFEPISTSDFYFAITHKDDPTEVIKWLNQTAETQEIATDFANQEFEEYKNGLVLKPEKYPENFLISKGKSGFVWFPKSFDDSFKDLADIAETEDWECHSPPTEYKRYILVNYVKYTYKRLAQENKIAISKNGRLSCFNTGLVTKHKEPIYAKFAANRKKDLNLEPWVFMGWLRHGDHKLNIFPKLPDIAHYINDPTCLYFDPKKDFRINIEHLVESTRGKERFPEPYKSMSDHELQSAIRGSIDNTKERVRRSYKTAIPCFYRDKINLLLPLCLKDQEHADLALAVEINEDGYRATTCLSLSMAYCDARLIAKPDSEWLIP